MRKLLQTFFALLPLFLSLATASFAQETPSQQNIDEQSNRRIFFEGRGADSRQQEYFYINFRREAGSTGYPAVNNKSEAAFVFRYNVINNPNIDVDPNQYILKISLINNVNNIEILSFDFFFSTLEEMDQHIRFIFFNAVSGVIPSYTEKEVIVVQEVVEEKIIHFVDTSWRDKWLYLKTGIDYPITFYALLPEGLKGGAGLYNDTEDQFQMLDHKILAMPGISLGVEAQFLNFMSLELNIQASMGDTVNNLFINLSAGAELKFPLKFFNNFMIEPYASYVKHFFPSKIFSKFPDFSIGGGVQISTRGGSLGAFYLDVKYLQSIGETAMHNPFIQDDSFPNPPEIYYNRFSVTFSVGYKFGFFDRNPRKDIPVSFPQPDSSDPHIHIFDY